MKTTHTTIIAVLALCAIICLVVGIAKGAAWLILLFAMCAALAKVLHDEDSEASSYEDL